MSTIQLASIAPNQVQDPIINQFVDMVSDIMKLSILQTMTAQRKPFTILQLKPLTVGGRVAKSYSSVGMVMASRLKQLPEEKRSKMLENSAKPTTFNSRLQTAAQQMKVNFDAPQYALEQIKLKSQFEFFNESYAKRLIVSVTDLAEQLQIADEPQATAVAAPAIVLNKGLKLRLHQVKCIDETDPEIFGRDEIAMGGTAVNEREVATKIAQFKVGNFDDGDVKNYNPVQILKSFDLTGSYPKTFAVFLSIAEKDSGGFGDFLTELYEAIKAELHVIFTALGAAAGAAIGVAVGGSVGTVIGGPIGTVIGVVSGLILGALVGWLASVFQDDIFEPQIAAIELTKADSTFAGGSLTSPQMRLVYSGHGGRYLARYSWQIVR